jgi:hypothetical protein
MRCLHFVTHAPAEPADAAIVFKGCAKGGKETGRLQLLPPVSHAIECLSLKSTSC